MSLIETRDITRVYQMGTNLVTALDHVTMGANEGEFVAIQGTSGSGKSTLLNLLGGLDRPTTGSIEVDGGDLGRMSSNQLARHRLSTVGMIFQSFNLIPSRTALENVELPMLFAGRRVGERRAAARQALEAVGLAERSGHRPTELSGGELQRVAIARALVNQPRLLLADEPTGNLDSVTAAAIMDVLLEHVRRHAMTLILVTHDEEMAGRAADRVLRLKDGQLEQG